MITQEIINREREQNGCKNIKKNESVTNLPAEMEGLVRQ